MILAKKVLAVGFIDGMHRWHWQVVECMCDPVLLFGQTQSGDYVFFEAEARHLQDWCKANDFEYYQGEAAVKFKMKAV